VAIAGKHKNEHWAHHQLEDINKSEIVHGLDYKLLEFSSLATH
jgi:hypothetical protein